MFYYIMNSYLSNELRKVSDYIHTIQKLKCVVIFNSICLDKFSNLT